MQNTKRFFSVLLAGFVSLMCPLVVNAQETETVTYDTAQHLFCMRDGKVTTDRNPVFRLRVTTDSISEEYIYRDGRVGGRKIRFRIRPERVACTITPTTGPAAEPVTRFKGLVELACRDNGLLIIQPVITEDLVERATDKALIYEYRIANGPQALQTFMLSLDGADCTVRALKD